MQPTVGFFFAHPQTHPHQDHPKKHTDDAPRFNKACAAGRYSRLRAAGPVPEHRQFRTRDPPFR